jgi:hypothetical protein
MNLHRLESQLANLDRLVPHLTEHGCDISAQDAARDLIRVFDSADLAHEHKVLGSTYERLRAQLKAIAEGRSGFLPVEQVAAFSRFYREHVLRAETGRLPRTTIHQLDS